MKCTIRFENSLTSVGTIATPIILSSTVLQTERGKSETYERIILLWTAVIIKCVIHDNTRDESLIYLTLVK